MFRARHITIALVALVGAVAAWWGVPAWRQMQAIRATGDTEPNRRAEAWASLMDASSGKTPAALTHLDAILDRLETAPDDALLDAADRLGPRGAWTWDRVPRDLVLRELAARVEFDDPVDAAPALERLETAPFDLASDRVVPLFNALLASDDPTLRRRTLDAACAWAGAERGAVLGELVVGDSALGRAWRLALAFSDRPDLAAICTDDTPVAEYEACLVAATRATPRDASRVLAAFARRVQREGTPAWAPILRGSDDPRAENVLRSLAREGDDAARYALQAADTEREVAVARAVAIDPGQPPWRRRLAAWRVPDLESDQLAALLDLPVADPDGSVFSATLLAERHPDAADRVETWIRDFDDDRKRAGAIGAALLDTHGPLLEEAFAIEDRPEVRTVQHVALAATGRGAGADADPLEVAHRAPPDPDGSPPADLLACLLIGGRVEALDWVTWTPPDPWPDPAMTTRHRAWLVERFAPEWHATLGRPIGGDVASLRLHADMLHAVATLHRRRLRFDATTRTFVQTPPQQQEVTGGR